MQNRLSILSSGLCKYTYYGKKLNSCKPSNKSISNLNHIPLLKSLSKSSAKQIKSILANWIVGVKLTQSDENNKVKHYSNYLSMITLTLPSKQYESDKLIKSKYLNLFLTKMRYYNDNFNYLWVSEKQKNGNIHFHIIVDKWFKKEIIQKLWNESLSTGEYINEFQKKFGYRNPPSTKITGQQGMKDAGDYLTSYVTKATKGDVIEGKVWDCSDNLLSICKLVFTWKDLYYNLIAVDFCRLGFKYIQNDFSELFLLSKGFVNSFLQMDIFKEIEEEIRQSLSIIFPNLYTPVLVKKMLPIPLSQLQLQF
ncbi:MAG: hypothetical protein WCG45_03280 [bacterium]